MTLVHVRVRAHACARAQMRARTCVRACAPGCAQTRTDAHRMRRREREDRSTAASARDRESLPGERLRGGRAPCTLGASRGAPPSSRTRRRHAYSRPEGAAGAIRGPARGGWQTHDPCHSTHVQSIVQCKYHMTYAVCLICLTAMFYGRTSAPDARRDPRS